MPHFIGVVAPTAIKLGATTISKVYVGSVQVYPSGLSGVNLGSEECNASDPNGTSRTVTASVQFNSAGTTTLASAATTNGTASTTAPALNWNTGGGTHMSYEIMSTSSYDTGEWYITPALAASTEAGENRIACTNNPLFDALATYTVEEPPGGSVDVTLRVSFWNAASGGVRTAYGSYRMYIAC